jgi:hypothetical protein
MSGWILLNDSVWTQKKITATVESLAAKREAELGKLSISIPPFNYQNRAPQPPQDPPFDSDLYRHLNKLNTAPPLEVTPVSGEKSLIQTSWKRGIWGRLHRQINDLVLFYINRAARQQSQINEELISTLNELTHVLTREAGSQLNSIERSRDGFSEEKKPGEKV